MSPLVGHGRGALCTSAPLTSCGRAGSFLRPSGRATIAILGATRISVTGSRWETAFWTVVFIGSTIGPVTRLITSWLRSRRRVLDWRLLTLLGALTLTSALSPDRLLTAGPVLLAAYTILAGSALGRATSLERLVGSFATATAVVLASSILLGEIQPALAFDPTGGSRGVLQSKNWFGAYAGLALVMSVLGFRLLRHNHALGLAALAVVSIAASNSRGGIVAAVVTISATVTLRLVVGAKRATKHAVGALSLLTLTSIALVTGGRSLLFSLTGREDDFSGRSAIWDASWSAVRARPFTGYGYGVYWNEASGHATELWASRGWEIPSSHSMYLEGLLWGGVIGLFALLVVGLGAIPPLLQVRPRRAEILGAGLICYVFCIGIIENAYPSWNLHFALLVASLVQGLSSKGGRSGH